jgi:hypothetical protein
MAIALVMETASTSETSANFCHTTRQYNPEHIHFHLVIYSECAKKSSLDQTAWLHANIPRHESDENTSGTVT